MPAPVRIERAGDIALVIADNPPVNAISAAVRQGLMEAIETADADPDARAIVIACDGATFFAGADIREFNEQPRQPFLPDLINRIEACSKPVVAAMHGTALGGGFEIALGCHWRVADPAAKMGLPETKLGLLPGAGGTQRLPRLIGPEAALDMILSGDPVDATRALKAGMIDELAQGDLREAAIEAARRLAREGGEPRRLSRDDSRIAASKADIAAYDAHAAAALARKRGYDFARACADSVRNAILLPFGEALTHERAFFLQLKEGPQSAAMRHLFFAERAALKIPGMPADTKARPVRKAAVIGSGTMGAGIAMCFADASIPVTLIDPNPEALERGLAAMRANYARSAAKSGKGEDWVEGRMRMVSAAGGLDGAAGADLVVEAVFEDMALKQQIFAELDRVTGPQAILATNTSTLDVNRIADATSRPEAVVGMHFFSPANVMRLLEVVQADRTSPEVLKTAIETGRKLRKLPVTVGVCYGFVGNRMLHARFGQVEALLLEGATPASIDRALTDFGFAMGPCAVSDLAGLDVGWRARQQAGRKAAVADAICALGRFGQKTGAGYYRYPEGSRRGEPDPEIEALIRGIAQERGIPRRSPEAGEIFERLVYTMINEGARILDEGVARRASDIDLIWVNGYGWPPYEGGPMFHADRIGLDRVASRLDELAARTGDESLRASPLLRRLAAEGGRFAQLAGLG